jgi:hypothetical protein
MSYNSTIKPKTGQCMDCPEDSKPQGLIAGRCERHYWQHRNEQKAGKGAGRVSSRLPDYAARKAPNKRIEGLGDWFVERRGEMTGYCQECGCKTAKHNDAFFTFSIAHILPKSIESGFPSVATNPNNWLELCIDCHTKYDRHWEGAAKMKSFPTAKARFLQFQHLIAPEERRRIPECFLT